MRRSNSINKLSKSSESLDDLNAQKKFKETLTLNSDGFFLIYKTLKNYNFLAVFTFDIELFYNTTGYQTMVIIY